MTNSALQSKWLQTVTPDVTPAAHIFCATSAPVRLAAGLAKPIDPAYTACMIGTTEILVIFLLVAVLFGARKLPELGKGLGEGIRHFRKSLKDEDSSDENEKKDTPGETK